MSQTLDFFAGTRLKHQESNAKQLSMIVNPQSPIAADAMAVRMVVPDVLVAAVAAVDSAAAACATAAHTSDSDAAEAADAAVVAVAVVDAAVVGAAVGAAVDTVIAAVAVDTVIAAAAVEVGDWNEIAGAAVVADDAPGTTEDRTFRTHALALATQTLVLDQSRSRAEYVSEEATDYLANSAARQSDCVECA